MKIAVPTSGGRLCPHFGHCDEFTLIDVDYPGKTIQGSSTVAAPPHQPGMLPGWLAQQGAEVILAGGMGPRAVELFNRAGISVHTGAPEEPPEDLVKSYLQGSLQLSSNLCDHPEGGHGGQCGQH